MNSCETRPHWCSPLVVKNSNLFGLWIMWTLCLSSSRLPIILLYSVRLRFPHTHTHPHPRAHTSLPFSLSLSPLYMSLYIALCHVYVASSLSHYILLYFFSPSLLLSLPLSSSSPLSQKMFVHEKKDNIWLNCPLELFQ